MSKNASVKKNDVGKAKSQTKSKSSAPTTKQTAPIGMVLQRAIGLPDQLSVQDVLQLQGAVGNQQVGQLLQRAAPVPRERHGRSSYPQIAPMQPVQRQPNRPLFNPSFRLNQPSHSHSLQRFVTKDQFVRLAGAPSSKAKLKKSTYTKILHKIDKVNLYIEQNNTKKKEEKLKDLISLIESWLGSHVENDRAKDSSDNRKYNFLSGLKMEAEAELGTLTDPLQKDDMFVPSQAIEAWSQMATMGTELNKSVTNELQENDKRKDEEKNKYIFSVFVDIINVDDREYIAKRTQLSIDNEKQKYLNNKRRKKNEIRIKSSSEIKQESATHVVDTKYKYDLDTTEGVNKRSRHIKDLADNAGSSGHTWVKLSVFNPDNELVSEKSAGFWPIAGTMGIKNTVPGIIKSPDPVPEKYQIETEDELGLKVKKQGLRRFDTVISGSNYRRAMNYVIGQMKMPRDYDLRAYNCTTFAKEVADQAGAPLPEKSYLAVPGGVMDVALGRNSVRLYSPDELYYALGDKADDFHNTYITSESDNSGVQKEEQWLRELDDLYIYLFEMWVAPSLMNERNAARMVSGTDVLDYITLHDSGVDSYFDVGDDSWEGENNSLLSYGDDTGTMYIAKNGELASFIDGVKNKIKERDEFRELAKKTNVYVPPQLRKKQKSKDSKVVSEEPMPSPKRVMTDERAVSLFQRHFSSGNKYDMLTLAGPVSVYSETDDQSYVFDSGDQVMAMMFFNGLISVEDSMNILYTADPKALATALGWWD